MWPFTRRTDDDFRREIEAHLALDADRLIAAGAPPDEAATAARRRFGNVTSAREQFYRSRRLIWLEDARRDLAYACKALFRHRRFSLAAVLTLAMGIGGSIAMFAVLDALFLRELPYRDAGRVALVWQTPADNRGDRIGVAPGAFLHWSEQATGIADLAALEPSSFDYLAGAEPITLDGALVTEGFFDVLGVEPVAGRAFAPADHVDGRSAVVLLSHAVWQRLFGGDPAVIGRSIVLESRPHTVVGILPSWMQPFTQRPSMDPTERFALGTARTLDVWAPKVVRAPDRTNRGDRFWNVVARLRPETTLTQAQTALSAISAHLAEQFPEAMSATVEPFRAHLVGRVRTPALVLGAAVTVVLLIACANVAALLLARGAQRKRELAVRVAIGASRGRLVRQLVMESAALACAATMLGLGLARWAIDVIRGLTPAYVPQLGALELDGRVLVFSIALGGLAALVFGVWPAVFWSRPVVSGTGADGGSQTVVRGGRHRVASTLVVTEVALTLVLLVGAGLLIRALGELARTDPGFDESNVAVLQVFAYGERYRNDVQRLAFFDEAMERLHAVPGVESVGLVSAMPFARANIGIRSDLRIAGRERPRANEPLSTFVTIASRDYFSVMRIPLDKGRAFADGDRDGAPPVVLINDVLERRYWPGRDPIGAEITVEWQGRPWAAAVIGVVGGLRHEGLDRTARPEIFLPFAQRPFGSMTFVVRSSTDPAALVPSLQAQVWGIDSTLPFYDTATLDTLVSRSLLPRRFLIGLLGAFSAVAMLLAVAGLYGVLSFVTSLRTREISLRIAMGAPWAAIIRLVVGQGMALVGAGVLLGLAGALALSRLLVSLLHSVSPTDPGTLLATTALLVAVAAVACYVPAHRAARVDPLLALKAD